MWGSLHKKLTLYVNIYSGQNLIITALADTLAPSSARSSADAIMTAELDIFCFEFLWLIVA